MGYFAFLQKSIANEQNKVVVGASQKSGNLAFSSLFLWKVYNNII